MNEANGKIAELSATLRRTNDALDAFQQGCGNEARTKLLQTFVEFDVLPPPEWSQPASPKETTTKRSNSKTACDESTNTVLESGHPFTTMTFADNLYDGSGALLHDLDLPNGSSGAAANHSDGSLDALSISKPELQAQHMQELELVPIGDDQGREESSWYSMGEFGDMAIPDQPAPNVSHTLEVKSLAHHETSFSRYLYRRSWETIHHMLSNPSTDQRWINRVFGNTLGYLTPSYVLSMVSRLLNTNDHEPLEFFHYPEFQSPRPDMVYQDRRSHMQSYLHRRSFDAQAESLNIAAREESQDRLMTPMDIEKFCVKNGMLSEFLTQAAPFWHKGILWELDLEKFVSGE